jgi:hypothetical protein
MNKKHGALKIFQYLCPLVLLALFSCPNGSQAEYSEPVTITGEQKKALFESIGDKIGTAYYDDNAHFIYDTLISVIEKNQRPLFDDNIYPANIYIKTSSYRAGVVESYFELGDMVFLNRDYITDASIGFVTSYDFTNQTVSYICVKGNRVVSVTAMVDPNYVSFNEFLLTAVP